MLTRLTSNDLLNVLINHLTARLILSGQDGNFTATLPSGVTISRPTIEELIYEASLFAQAQTDDDNDPSRN